MSKKFLTAVVAAGVLWMVVLGQVFCTRIWVAKNGLTQAFTGNNMVVMQETKQDLYGNEYYCSNLMDANPDKLDYLIFPAGIKLKLPEDESFLENKVSASYPEWRRLLNG